MATVQDSQPAEYLVERSRFVGQAFRIVQPEELAVRLALMRSAFPAANHYTWAYRIDPAHTRASDQGEPHGTAGRPMLHILSQAGWTETMVVVVRYFGGIKLGRGGLVHAYQETAQRALNSATRGVTTPIEHLTLRLSYRAFDRVIKRLEPLTLQTTPEFSDHVDLRLRLCQTHSAALRDLLAQQGGNEWEVLSSQVDLAVIPEDRASATGLLGE